MTTVLITGAAGMIASELRTRLSPRFSLKLTDIEPVGPLSGREQFVAADLADTARLESLMDGVDAVVHLGGIAVEESWDKIMPANVAGAYNLFEAARRPASNASSSPPATTRSASFRAARRSTIACCRVRTGATA